MSPNTPSPSPDRWPSAWRSTRGLYRSMQVPLSRWGFLSWGRERRITPQYRRATFLGILSPCLFVIASNTVERIGCHAFRQQKRDADRSSARHRSIASVPDLAKRSHGSQRVHIVSPLHNLAVLDSDDRDEPVVVGCAGSDNPTVYLVFEDHHTSILRSMHDERVRAVQQDVLAVARIKCHQCFATINLLRISRKNISILEDCVVGDGIEIMVAIDLTGQTLLHYVEERVERREGLVLWIGDDWSPVVMEIYRVTRLDRINTREKEKPK